MELFNGIKNEVKHLKIILSYCDGSQRKSILKGVRVSQKVYDVVIKKLVGLMKEDLEKETLRSWRTVQYHLN